MTDVTELQAHLDAINRAVNAAGERMVGHGERAHRRERRKVERRKLAKQIVKLRRAIGKPIVPTAPRTLPPPSGPMRAVDMSTIQPIARGAP